MRIPLLIVRIYSDWQSQSDFFQIFSGYLKPETKVSNNLSKACKTKIKH